MTLIKLIKKFIPEFVKQNIKIALMQRRYPFSKIYSGAEVGQDCKLEKNVVIFRGAQIALRTFIGRYTYVQSGSVLWNVEIGSFCSVARNVTIGLAAHPTDMVSTSPVFYDDKVPLPRVFIQGTFFKDSLPRTFIGSDVWIGEGAKIRAGVKIGNGSVIGAGSIVTKNIPPYSICAGVPCKVIRKRFSDESILLVESSRWWDWDEMKLVNNAKSFHKIQYFKKLMNSQSLD